MSVNGNPLRFEREGRRKRKHLSLSMECIEVIDLVAEDHNEHASQEIERIIWEAVVDEYGREKTLEMIEQAQADLEPEQRLERDMKPEYYEITP